MLFLRRNTIFGFHIMKRYEELEYAFTPVCFEIVFKVGVIDKSLKSELLAFKKEVDKIPTEMSIII